MTRCLLCHAEPSDDNPVYLAILAWLETVRWFPICGECFARVPS